MKGITVPRVRVLQALFIVAMMGVTGSFERALRVLAGGQP